ncbi:zona pellucida sperm-binding protein 3d.2 isoform X1 [Gadus chalcogrammus]|uniref:zona pellucida sperm-binding protein 3d.2 isoform X1 n=1 Tax=Gadus chalcogrammus TaxID=1042646 RepID=UPI0024C4ACCA|nr:zona pellucida sperm-binding protein 3d.2 isoform X1 [Gadus chalcogrammus]
MAGSAIILKVATILICFLSAGTTETSRRSRRSSGDQILPSSYLHLPDMLHSRNPLLPTEYFSPSRGTGSEPLPSRVRDLLLPVTPTPASPASALEPGSINTRCDGDKMDVQVHKSVLGWGGSASHLSVGTCRPTGSTGQFIYFEIRFNQCRTVRMVINNGLVYSNTLRYDPPPPPGPIRRVVPFTLPVSCQYDRYHYSYKIGYIPKIETQGVLKPITSREDFTLTPRNARWKRLSPWERTHVLGKPIFFEVSTRSLAPGRRLFVESCFATQGTSTTSTPRLSIVNNFGCMVKQIGRSRFIPSSKKRVRFIVDAFLFNATVQPLYMHCAMSTADSTATPTAKACTYDYAKKQWREVSGQESVCSCCATSCSSAPSSDVMVRSKSWTMEHRGKPSADPKKNINVAAATTMTPKTVKMLSKFRTLQQNGAGVSPVDVYAREWQEKALRGLGGVKEVLNGSGGVKEVLRGSGRVKEVLRGFGGVKEVPKGSARVKEVLRGSARVKEVLRGSGGTREVLRGSGGIKEVPKGSARVKEVLRGSVRVKEVLRGSGGTKEVLRGSGGAKEVWTGSGGAKEVLKGSARVKKILKGSGGGKEVLRGSGGAKEVLRGSGGAKEVRTGSGDPKAVLKGSARVKKVLKGSVGAKEVLRGSGGAKAVLTGSGGAKAVLKGSVGAKEVLRGSVGAKEVLMGSGGTKEVLRGSGGAKEVLTGSGGGKEVLKGSARVKKVLKGLGGSKEVLRGSVGAKEVLRGSGGTKEVLRGSGGTKEVLRGSGGTKEHWTGSVGAKEVLKGTGWSKEVLRGLGGAKEVPGPKTLREGLKGSEGGLNVFSGKKEAVKGSGADGKVVKESEDVLEHVGVEPHRIFETFFGFDK